MNVRNAAKYDTGMDHASVVRTKFAVLEILPATEVVAVLVRISSAHAANHAATSGI